MSFAEEVATVTKSVEYKGTEQFNQEIPILPKPGDAEEAKAEAAKTAPEAPAEAKVKIGDMEFNSVQEAYVHALAQVTESNKAMQATVSKLTEAKPEPTEVEEAWNTKMEKLFFTNPAEAIQEIYAKASRDAVSQVETKITAQQEAQVKAQQYESFMQNILTNNAELADFRSVIENVVLADTAFWDSVKDLPLPKAEAAIAEKTRALLKIKKNSEAKTTELPPGPARMAGATGNPVSTEAVTSSAPIDFITQLRKHNKRSK